VLGGLGFFVIRNTYNSHFGYYLTLIILILSVGAVAIAVGGNVYAALNPTVLAASSSLSQEEKMQGYTSYMFVVYLLPLMLSLLAFKFYEWSVGRAEFNIVPKKSTSLTPQS
jgi:hypothetical protein